MKAQGMTKMMTNHAAVAPVDFISADMNEERNSSFIRRIDQHVTAIDVSSREIQRTPKG